ncbi:MAG: MFS transporter [Dongiaceae bacterium]
MTTEAFAWTRAFVRPGAVVFASLFALDSMARATLSTVIPLQAYAVLGSERDVSLLFFAVGWVGIAATLFIPVLVRRFRPRWVYTMAAALLVLAPLLLALASFAGFVAGMFLRAYAAACLLNLLNLYIMAYIRKRDLSRSEPLRTLFSAVAWSIGPMLGPYLYEEFSPNWAFGLSAACAVLHLAYFWWLRLEYGPALAPGQPVNTNPFPHIRRYAAQPRLVLAWLLNFGRETWWVAFFVYTPIQMKELLPGGVTIGGTVLPGGFIGGFVVSCGTVLLFASHAMGWIARLAGLRRHMMVCFLLGAVATAAATVATDSPGWLAAALLAGAVGAVGLDAVCVVPYLRAVRARERPEMTMVFSLYRDFAGLAPMALFALLLTFFEMPAVYAAVALGMAVCALLAHWLPRSM